MNDKVARTPHSRFLRDKYGDEYLVPKESTIEGICGTILGISDSYRQIVHSELRQSQTLLAAVPPDRPGALFHAFRSIEGYLESVIMGPTLEVVIDPVAELFEHGQLVPINVLNSRFKRGLRDRVLTRMCSPTSVQEDLLRQVHQFDPGTELSRLRNEVFHGFIEPTADQVQSCMDLARSIVDTIEEQRRRGLLRRRIASILKNRLNVSST